MLNWKQAEKYHILDRWKVSKGKVCLLSIMSSSTHTFMALFFFTHLLEKGVVYQWCGYDTNANLRYWVLFLLGSYNLTCILFTSSYIVDCIRLNPLILSLRPKWFHQAFKLDLTKLKLLLGVSKWTFLRGHLN